MFNTRTINPLLDEHRGEVSALLFGEIMQATREAIDSGHTERARGLAEAGEILSGIPCAVLLDRLR